TSSGPYRRRSAPLPSVRCDVRVADRGELHEERVGEGRGRIRSPEGSADTVAVMSEHSMSERIEQLQKRKEEALHAGSERSVERKRARGRLLARERIEYLLDPGSFHELDMLARHRAHESGLLERPYTDGVVTGGGTIDGRKVFLFSRTSPCSAAPSARCSPRRSTRSWT